MYKFVIDSNLADKGRLGSLNEYINDCRRNVYKANNAKKRDEQIVSIAIRRDLKKVRITRPVWLHYHFYEVNAMRDWDNVTGYAHKIIQDALVRAGVLKDDSQRYVTGYTDYFYHDKKNPRIEVEIEEVEE